MKFTSILLSLLISVSLYAESQIPFGLIRPGNGDYYSKYTVVVDKAARKTSVWAFENNQLKKVEEYVSDQGKKDGDKQVVGDHKTPEGIYFFQEMLEGNQIPYDKYGVRAFTTNYPNLFDKLDNKTGSGIWLHAIPDSESLERGSRGCVVIRNTNILDVSKYISLGTTAILIYGSAKYTSQEEVTQTRSKIETLLKTWRNAWIGKDINTYINFYSDSFYSANKNKLQWYKHKKNLNSFYSNIFVDFSDPVIYEHDDRIIVRTLQHYKSDHMDDFGEKYIYLKKENGEYKIIAEKWFKVPAEKARPVILAGTVLRDQKVTSRTDSFKNTTN